MRRPTRIRGFSADQDRMVAQSCPDLRDYSADFSIKVKSRRVTEQLCATPSATSVGTPLVSIIVNNYNYGRFLGEAIDSALAQTYPNKEVIVVDDGSRDNSREVIAGYGRRILPVLKENGGQASAFNAGFKASKGELILFLDSDDMLEPEAIETTAREWRDGVARMVFPLEVVDKSGRPLGKTVGGKELPSPALGPFGVGTPTSGNVFSRAALEKILPMPEEGWRIAADLFLTAACLFGETLCLRQPLGKYRVHRDAGHPQDNVVWAVTTHVSLDLKLHDTLFRLTGGKIGSLEHWLSACPQHWIMRIKSLRESPNDYPWPDSLPGLTLRAIKATWRQPDRNFRRRLAYSIFAFGYAVLPKKATGAMWRVDGGERGRVLKRLLGT
ncbi:MAG: glycosyltransferase family 2 protein [Acidobacteria bacterium]|nr:MAG: glycosyltransferase family 2 protein [Acidobacteriota bacterium]